MTMTALELEQITDMSAPVNSSVLPRWQRKALAANKTSGDRFIPNRDGMNMDVALMNLTTENKAKSSADNVDPAENEFQKTLKSSLINGGNANVEDSARVLAFCNKAPAPATGYHNQLKVLYSQNKGKTATKAKLNRAIADAPTRILDAPDMVDDYYLNLLDWSTNNTLAVALGQVVYLWNAASGEINELMSVDGADDHITSVSWIGEGGGHLAVGTNSCDVQLWDTGSEKQVRTMGGHEGRVGALSWNQHLLSSGSRDGTIINHDVRIREHATATLASHTQEVCGLKWNREGTMLASGGNDNLLCLWDAAAQGRTAARHQLTGHNAAVKALAWSPHERNLLATGGGTADRCIKFWNTQNGACLNTIDTGSQVCSLLWSPTEKEILSSHGFSQNQLSLYNYPSMQKTKELIGHTARVLHMAASPNGTTVCSAAADETLRFWDVFAEVKAKGKSGFGSTTLGSMRSIR
jgi:cell division cycle protein 20 (cofactor of APC complex)